MAMRRPIAFSACRLYHHFRFLHRQAFGDLKLDRVGRQVVSGQRRFDPLREAAPPDLRHADVHRHVGGGVRKAADFAEGRARRIEYPVTDLDDQPGVFGERDEDPGRLHETVVTRPAYQRLDADDPAAGERYLRLVPDGQLAMMKILTQAADDVEAPARVVLHLRDEIFMAAVRAALGAVQRDVGPLEERDAGPVILERPAKAERDRYRQLMFTGFAGRHEGVEQRFRLTRASGPIRPKTSAPTRAIRPVPPCAPADARRRKPAVRCPPRDRDRR